MSDQSRFKHSLLFDDAGKKQYERIAALLGLEDWCAAIGVSGRLGLKCAEQYIKGKTSTMFVTPEFAELYQNNKEFFDELCVEGMVEWLTPLVLSKPVTPHLKHYEK